MHTNYFWRGWDAYANGEPLEACRSDLEIRGWMAALHAEADSQTDTWLVEHRPVVVYESSIEDDYDWIRTGC